MRAIHPDPRRFMLAALAALALTVMALWLAAALSDSSFSLSLPGRSDAPPAQVVHRSAPAPLENPLDSPLMRWLR